MKILIVEDEKELRIAIKRGLSSNGYTVEEAEDGQVALEKISIYEYDLILLDINLPKLDGFEVCKKIREEKNNVPVIMLTARVAIDDKVGGLDIGADDYIEKPFSFRELLARIEAVSRRKQERTTNIIDCKNLRIDTLKKRAWVNDNEISLTIKEYEILEYLLKNKGKVVKSEELFEHVWSDEANPFSKTIKVQLSNIRKKLLESDPENIYIQTIKSRGYIIE